MAPVLIPCVPAVETLLDSKTVAKPRMFSDADARTPTAWSTGIPNDYGE